MLNDNQKARFLAKVDASNIGGCWTWTGAQQGTGYGVFNGGDHYPMRLVHRISYSTWIGKIFPEDSLVCHACDNKLCVKPAHLFLGTQTDNLQDAKSKGRLTQGQWAKSKTHCPSGHEYTPENTRIYRRGRNCRACNRLRLIKLKELRLKCRQEKEQRAQPPKTQYI